jgi:hypothetical protein
VGHHSHRSYVNAAARWNGIALSEGEADYIIWNRTGFPCFWDDDPWESFTQQVREHFRRQHRGNDVCIRCGREMPKWIGDFCFECSEEMESEIPC